MRYDSLMKNGGHRFDWLLVAMMGLRWGMVGLLLAGIPRLPLRENWLTYPAGDQEIIFFAAFHLSRGIYRPTVAGLGQILVMFVYWKAQQLPLWVNVIRPLTGRTYGVVSYTDILPELLFTNAFVLGGVSIVLVGLLARAITGRKGIGLAAAAGWLLTPYLIAPVRCIHLDPVGNRADIVPTLLWMNGLSDGPGFFFVLLSTWLAWLAIERRRKWLLATLGISLAATVTFRAVMLPAALMLWAVVATKLGWRAALGMTVAGLLAYVPQMAFNQKVYGFPITSGYMHIGAAPGLPRTLQTDALSSFFPFDPRYLAVSAPELAAQCPALVPVVVVAGAVAGLGLVWLWRRRGWEQAALLAAPLPYLLLVVTFIDFRQDPVRLTMLSLPYVYTACSYAVTVWWRERVARPLPSPP